MTIAEQTSESIRGLRASATYDLVAAWREILEGIETPADLGLVS